MHSCWLTPSAAAGQVTEKGNNWCIVHLTCRAACQHPSRGDRFYPHPAWAGLISGGGLIDNVAFASWRSASHSPSLRPLPCPGHLHVLILYIGDCRSMRPKSQPQVKKATFFNNPTAPTARELANPTHHKAIDLLQKHVHYDRSLHVSMCSHGCQEFHCLVFYESFTPKIHLGSILQRSFQIRKCKTVGSTFFFRRWAE